MILYGKGMTQDIINRKWNRRLAWGLCLLAVVGITAVILVTFVNEQRQGLLDGARIIEVGGVWIILTAFAVLGALIISRQPHNRIGWLLMLPVLVRIIPVELIAASPPQTLTLGWWFFIWFAGWAWMPLVFPILLLPLHFPTGRPPTPKWRWVNRLAWGMWVLLAFVTAVPTSFVGFDHLHNPIGFLPPELPEQVWSSAPWSLSLLLIALTSVISLFVRYRRAPAVERQQIKWLLYACLLFAISYGLVVTNGFTGANRINDVVLDLLFYSAVLAFAGAIGIAILRYQLFDIDVIIRKTVQYGVVTAVLALVYFGTIILLQSLLGQATGEQSPIIIVLSTLLIAALFNPLRRRVQDVIDRRFFRKKYDAAQVLADFAQTARDEVDMEALQAELLRVVQETLQPESIAVWFKQSEGKTS
jgi:hypothetical protein